MSINKKKKQGSALIVVIIFSAFFIAISSVSVMAVVTTFQANNAEEGYQTLYYEAEGGIAEARARANAGDYDLLGEPGEDTIVKFNYPESVTNDYIFVKVEFVTDGAISYLQVTSTAVKDGVASDDVDTTTKKKRTVKAKIRAIMDNNDIFKYSICGNKVNLESSGSLNGDTTGINSALDSATISSGSPSDPPLIGDETNDLFALPDFDETKIKKYEGVLDINVTLGDIGTQLEMMIHPTLGEERYRESIKKVTVNDMYGATYPVYLIYADGVNIKIPAGAVTFNNAMVLTNGTIKVSGEGVSSTIYMTRASLIGDEVDSLGCAFHINFTPAPNEGTGESPLNSFLDEDRTKLLIEGIAYYAPNLGSGSVPPPGASDKGKFSGYDYE